MTEGYRGLHRKLHVRTSKAIFKLLRIKQNSKRKEHKPKEKETKEQVSKTHKAEKQVSKTREPKKRTAKRPKQPNSPPSFINALPEEILSYIFLLFSHDQQSGLWGRSGKCEILMLVCTRWQSTALSTQQLWTSFDLSCPRMVPLFLRRSGAALINVTFTSKTVHLTDLEYTRRIWKQVVSSSQRISSLRLIDSREGDRAIVLELLQLLGDPNLSWPSLTELEFLLDTRGILPQPDFIEFHGLGPLTRLRLNKIYIPFASLALGPRLRELHLGVMSMRISTLVSVLQRCNGLEELSLSHLTLYGFESDRERLKEAPIHSIQRLCIDQLSSEDTRLFLEHPNLSDKAFIRATVRNVPLNHRVLARFHEYRYISVIFDQDKKGYATVKAFGKVGDDMDPLMLVQEDNRSISVLDGVNSRDLLELLSKLGSSTCEVFTIGFTKTEILTTAQWQKILAHFPNLNCLNLMNISPLTVSEVVTPIQALGSLCGGQGYAAPHLRQINLGLCGVAEILDDHHWDEVVTGLKALREGGRKLGMLRVIYAPRFGKPDPQVVERRRELIDMLTPHVDSIVFVY